MIRGVEEVLGGLGPPGTYTTRHDMCVIAKRGPLHRFAEFFKAVFFTAFKPHQAPSLRSVRTWKLEDSLVHFGFTRARACNTRAHTEF